MQHSKPMLSDSDSDEEKVGRKSQKKGNKSKGVGKNSKSRSPRKNQQTKPCIIINKDVYIQIPLSVMSGNESTSIQNQLSSHEDESPSSPVEGQNIKINYKLIEGFPSCADIRKRKSYVMSYNKETNNADWVYEILNKSTLEERCKEHMSFGKNELEENYQQGHLAAAANHRWCQEAYHDTYLPTNMIPQLSKANQGIWKTLEDNCRGLAKDGCNVHVYSGPLYLHKETNSDYVRDPNASENKAVPSHLFKVVIVETEGRVKELKCYVIPNEESEYTYKIQLAENFPKTKLDLEEFLEDQIETIEKWSGLKFKIDKPQHNMSEQTETITWEGEDKQGKKCEAKIEVKIQKRIQCILQ